MSTPIENNTAELQDIVNRVYNLPNIEGGSSAPDLVIGIEMPYSDSVTLSGLDVSHVTIKSGSVANTYAKLQERKEVKVFAEHEYWYGGYYKFTGVLYPSAVSMVDCDHFTGMAVMFVSSTRLDDTYSGKLIRIVFGADGTLQSANVLDT